MTIQRICVEMYSKEPMHVLGKITELWTRANEMRNGKDLDPKVKLTYEDLNPFDRSSSLAVEWED